MAFKRCDRLNKSSIISLVSRKGASLKTPFFRVKFLPARFGNTKIAIIISKKVEKSAVRRNCIRRKLSSCVQNILKKRGEREPSSFLILFFPTKKVLEEQYEYTLLEEHVVTSFEKIEQFSFQKKKNRKNMQKSS